LYVIVDYINQYISVNLIFEHSKNFQSVTRFLINFTYIITPFTITLEIHFRQTCLIFITGHKTGLLNLILIKLNQFCLLDEIHLRPLFVSYHLNNL
jgi:hypothetical protein